MSVNKNNGYVIFIGGRVIGFILGTVYANAAEWVLHRFVLHGAGKRRGSTWAFHFHEHHRACRRNWMLDADYERSLWGWHAQSKEGLAIVGLCALHAPLVGMAPGFVLGVCVSGWNYYRWHRRSHEDPEWARKHLPWHYDHHMGPDQDMNWCVSWPWFDWVMGTRKPYTGTDREQSDRSRYIRRGGSRTVRQNLHMRSQCVTEPSVFVVSDYRGQP